MEEEITERKAYAERGSCRKIDQGGWGELILIAFFFIKWSFEFCHKWVNIPKCKDLSVREKDEMLKKYDYIQKCSLQEVSSKVEISKIDLFNLLNPRKSISDYIKTKKNLSWRKKCGGKSDKTDFAVLNWFEDMGI